MSVFTGGPYGRLAVMLNTLSSLNIEIIIIIIIIPKLLSAYVEVAQVETKSTSGQKYRNDVAFALVHCHYVIADAYDNRVLNCTDCSNLVSFQSA